MIHEAELAKAIAQTEQARKRNTAFIAKLTHSINEAEDVIAKFSEQSEKEIKRTTELLKENVDLKTQLAAVRKELTDERMRSNRLEVELSKKVHENQNMKVKLRKEIKDGEFWIAAEDDYDERMPTSQQKEQESEERMIAMSTVLSFGTTRMTQEAVQTVVDLLFFAINDRTPEEEKSIKQLMTDFRKALRPQMDVKDSTQNFYMK